MEQAPRPAGKPTLDKDLDRMTLHEQAAHHVARPLIAPGLGLLFLIAAAIIATATVIQQPGSLLVIAAATIAAYMAMNIGANDVTNNVGPAVGAKALSMGAALMMAALFETAGALIAGGDVVETISDGIISPAAISDPGTLVRMMIAALLSSALFVNIATLANAPVSTTHTVVGGVLGSGIAAAGLDAVNWPSMAGITASWVISPVLGGLIAAGFLYVIKETVVYRDDKIAAARVWVPVLIGVMAGSFSAYLAFKGLNRLFFVSLPHATFFGFATGILSWLAAIPFIRSQAAGLENRNQSLRKLFRLPLVLTAAILCFGHGANDVSNAVGPLSAIVNATERANFGETVAIPFWVMLIGGLGISVGLILFGPRLINLVGAQITKLNPMRAFSVSLSTGVTVIVASWLGLPVSTTHIAVGAVFGVGFFREWYTRNSSRRLAYMHDRSGMANRHEHNPDEVRRRYLVRRSHFMTIIAAWVLTVPASAAMSAALYGLMSLFF
ncbi:inorganic phosphate transporter [Rhizobiaceae bacterium BDR2-2]|uniref:Phosphate transporter n=1 Tax=Ectorhizobium quercum TaxID=2965071 RepID=A0AAE3N150_9HYPH|nr:inorganic phosphate transporter [Ectorhizobium quercum]MCX8996272.1 inorganic phosphate transporter [Ectorhizobium quercum]MCX8998689.1 inorganic phosphate transporter [Ectorhizobium quercum]